MLCTLAMALLADTVTEYKSCQAINWTALTAKHAKTRRTKNYP